MVRKMWLALSGVVVVSLLFITALTPKAQAFTRFKSADSITIASNQTIDSNLWAGARNIDIAGTVNGDLYCGAATLNISGTIKGDVICAAQTINISGHIEGNVRLAAQSLDMSGSIGKNVTLVGQTINIDSRAQIAGDAAIAGSNLNLNGKIGRDLSLAMATVNIAGDIGRDINGTVNKMTVGGSAKVGGGIDYTSKNKAVVANGAVIGSKVTQRLPQEKKHSYAGLLFIKGWSALFFGLMLIVSALIVTAIFPHLIHSVSEYGMLRPWWSLLTGFLASILAPIVLILLLLTFLGIPLAILFLLAWLLVNLSSGLFASYYLGRQVLRNQTHPLLIILAGSVLLVLLYFIPFLNILILVLATWLGQGMLLLALRDMIPAPKYKLRG